MPVSAPAFRLALLPLALIFQLAGCASPVMQEGGLANPPLSEKGVVYLFAGLTPAGDDMARSGMYSLTQYIRASGVRADVYNPVNWKEAADNFLAQPNRVETPVAVAGYSLGGNAATQFADRLQAAGVPVQTLLAFEAYKPTPVSCNVRRAIDMYGSDGLFSMSSRLRPEKSFTGRLQTVDWSKLHKNGRHDHLGVSKEPAALEYVKHALIDGGRVRPLAPSPGEAACLGARTP
ncbi:thioesterase domain-containing protein [Mesorhizobium sp. LHD-90]|uniref:thioesterase domain-containing protein n=1 Tax=Mesorhizobium sp. LHD-90 TaxID=3071414 RepID=UPI0027DECF04|nr:thioesterase domain-containing protein [Mesorhizobium sp. LHD-90]MDQ6432681.1 thioesterase domain-containing protein [Mesorhizobium sp. LHD-90]